MKLSFFSRFNRIVDESIMISVSATRMSDSPIWYTSLGLMTSVPTLTCEYPVIDARRRQTHTTENLIMHKIKSNPDFTKQVLDCAFWCK